MERYDSLERPGLENFGKFSCYRHALDKHTDEHVVIKRVRCDYNTEETIRDTKREVSILKDLSTHENIVHLNEFIDESSHRMFYLVFEYVASDLKDILWRHQHDNNSARSFLSEDTVRSYLYQALKGLVFCHEKGILHRDLKPSHILISKDGKLKLSGFRLSRSMRDGNNSPLTHEVVTLWYRPPEILLGSKTYDTSIDIWSLGCIFAEMIMAYQLFPGNCEIDQLYKIFQQLGTPNDCIWPGVTSLADWNVGFPKWYQSDFHLNIRKNVDPFGYELLEMFLMHNPLDRISAKDALDHPYFDNESLE